ncbi:MAG: M10 family metallopeptidase C-terminal domain-containing protein, partial [Paracoccus sp. (in: a-proteobacteria)]|uniref:calcium-binding protein n=1 Tax=Paracoccus sp. TaxID=267 RepID=UPI0026DF5E20
AGGEGEDRLFGEAGNDRLAGGEGSDTLNGGAGNDSLFGEAGNDSLLGMSGNDLMYGGEGADTLAGGEGEDRLFGEAGNDRLIGGTGADTMHGGAGADVFVFNRGDNSVAAPDLILDFRSGEDRLDLRSLNLTFESGGTFTGTAGQLIIETYGFRETPSLFPEKRILIDLDGDSQADMRIDLQGAMTLLETDFFL